MCISFKSLAAVLGLSLLLAAVGGSPARAERQCGAEPLTGRATHANASQAIRRADQAWVRMAIAQMGTRVIFHEQPRLDCSSNKGGSGYSCTISAKACTDADIERTARRPTCGQAGDCEVCCGALGDPDYSCRPTCK